MVAGSISCSETGHALLYHDQRTQSETTANRSGESRIQVSELACMEKELRHTKSLLHAVSGVYLDVAQRRRTLDK